MKVRIFPRFLRSKYPFFEKKRRKFVAYITSFPWGPVEMTNSADTTWLYQVYLRITAGLWMENKLKEDVGICMNKCSSSVVVVPFYHVKSYHKNLDVIEYKRKEINFKRSKHLESYSL
ncbi:hypothetical protein GQ55_5G079500 [Panicum hallii var. hallii]|uniref:Uncharacterized protein n=1 Tax=Panicum hallii var. hallii TaxID=1504633 RepID=A0A2T7DE12_9POAL|nr:hypothetical protein GQ55_5G079500 [Panicum hallii var. hallii]PUZ53808.1 hypothetical protein GQ55_5G079500 [Panicum hallii var. hallii]